MQAANSTPMPVMTNCVTERRSKENFNGQSYIEPAKLLGFSQTNRPQPVYVEDWQIFPLLRSTQLPIWYVSRTLVVAPGII